MDPLSREYAEQQDAKDPLRRFRDMFIIPTKADLASKTLKPKDQQSELSTYLCGNSLSVQPKNMSAYFQHYFQTWASKAFTDTSRESRTPNSLRGYMWTMIYRKI